MEKVPPRLIKPWYFSKFLTSQVRAGHSIFETVSKSVIFHLDKKMISPSITFYINGILFTPNTNRRRTARNLGVTEREIETQLLERINSTGFQFEKSNSHKWLKQVLHIYSPKQAVNTNVANSIAKFLSIQLNIEFGREYYRRRSTVMFWFDEHIEEIRQFLSTHYVVFVIEDNTFLLHPPSQLQDKTITAPPTPPTPPSEDIQFSEFFDLDDSFPFFVDE